MKLTHARIAALLLSAACCAAAVPAAAAGAPDGNVDGLSPAVLDSIYAIKSHNPGPLSDADAQLLADAIQRDGSVDPAEADLLRELTQDRVRSITFTQDGVRVPVGHELVLFPASGKASQILKDVLYSPADLTAAWAKPNHGWIELLARYRLGSEYEQDVVDFVESRLGEQWALSSMANSMKPIRNLVGDCYDASMKAGGENVETGRVLLFRAMRQLDERNGDKVPDFLYNWVKPSDFEPIR